MIREGRFVPGDQLPSEKEIMEELGVGRSTVREAMLVAAENGLVDLSSGERARVTTPTATALVDELSGAARLLLARKAAFSASRKRARCSRSAWRALPPKPRRRTTSSGCGRRSRPTGRRSATALDSCAPMSPFTMSSPPSRGNDDLHRTLQCRGRMADRTARDFRPTPPRQPSSPMRRMSGSSRPSPLTMHRGAERRCRTISSRLQSFIGG